jgi:ligand-binding sensor domain-containing protein/serine phosphatase RsbU (regulator of sigma subunit)
LFKKIFFILYLQLSYEITMRQTYASIYKIKWRIPYNLKRANSLYMKKLIPIFLLFLYSCNQGNDKQQKVYRVNENNARTSIAFPKKVMAPKVLLVDNSKLNTVAAGKPQIINTNTNIFSGESSKNIITGKPEICIPGKDSFLLPKITSAVGRTFLAGIPQIVTAKDMVSKDHNPANFSTYGKLQGLMNGTVRCILSDKIGNVWIGTYGGLSRFDGKNFTNFTQNEGLPNNTIFSLLEAKNGNIWIGTNGGLVCYDGKIFTTFTKKEGLPNEAVLSLLQDKNGNLWIGTYGGGACIYDGKKFIGYSTKQGLANNTVFSMLEDKNGRIWLGTDGGGVSIFDGISFTNYTVKEGLVNNAVYSILEDDNGFIWLGTYGGLCKYDGKSFTVFSLKQYISSEVVFSLLKDKNGNIWMGTSNGGAIRYDGKLFTKFEENEGLVSNSVLSMSEDKYANIWLGTYGGGICRYDGKSFSSFMEKEGLPNSNVFSIMQDKSENIWLGTNGGGATFYNGKSFVTYTTKEGLPSNVVYSILEDKEGNIWLGTDGGGVSRYDGKYFTNFSKKEGLSNSAIFSILQDKKGNIWFGSYGDGVHMYDGKSLTSYTEEQGLANNTVFSMLEDKKGRIWIGTFGGVSCYDGKSFANFTMAEGLPNNTVFSLLEDKKGNIWLGTDGGGVSCYDGKSFTNINEKEGLVHNSVLSIVEEKNGDILFGTGLGLSKLKNKKFPLLLAKIKNNSLKEDEIFFKNFTYSDGFLGIGCNRNAMLEAKDGSIWTGTNDRLIVYHPKGELTDTIAPYIQLTNIELFNEKIDWTTLNEKKDTSILLGNGVKISNFNFDGLSRWCNLPEHLSLAYNNNYITFNFIGITQMQSNKVKYQYLLEGIDENWSAINNRTDAPYGNLPQGTYTFKVKAMNSEGFWSNELHYTFTIRPPWWKTWWFRSVSTLIVICFIGMYIKNRERKLVKQKQILEETVIERTVEIVAQKDVIEKQKQLVEKKHKEITDSINYAERIQRSFLATKNLLDENLNDHFVFFKPKDVVSGDFYWATKLVNGNFVLVIADSTGHGVPGAIMSLLNITSLEKAIEKNSNPADILNDTRKTIIERLKKDGSIEGGMDGMDCILISFDFNKNRLTYAAANNAIWIVRQNELLEFKSDKMPVARHERDNIQFSEYIIELLKGDVIYTFTDGMSDQFGGPKGKKFMHKQLKQLFISIAHLPMSEQKEMLANALNDWKGDLAQVDDVCIIGVRI